MGENKPEVADVDEGLEVDLLAWKQQLADKNAMLDKCRLKIKRYEFAIKEALLFLSKPLATYDDWLYGRDGASPLDALNAALNGALQLKAGLEVASDPPSGHTESKNRTRHLSMIPINEPTPTKPQQSSIFYSSKPTPAPVLVPQAGSKQEMQTFEIIRLALSYLRNAQKAGEAIDKGEHDFTKPIPKLLPTENESLALLQGIPRSVGEGGSTEDVKSPTPQAQQSSTTARKADRRLSHPTNPTNSSVPLVVTRHSSMMDPRDNRQHEEEGDLGSVNAITDESADSVRRTSSIRNKCESCRELRIRIDHLNDTIKDLETRVKASETKLAKEIKMRDRLQESKNIIDQELEELTSQLFDQANQMVVEETRNKDALETANKQLKNRVQDLSHRLRSREEELTNMKKNLYMLQSKQLHSTTFSSPVLDGAKPEGSVVTPGADSRQQHHVEHQNGNVIPVTSHTIIAGFDNFQCAVGVDSIIFQEFQEHIKVTILGANLPPAQNLANTHSTLFMRRCMIEDVEPTIHYTYSPMNAFKAVGPGTSQSFRKKLLDSIMKGQIHIRCVLESDVKDDGDQTIIEQVNQPNADASRSATDKTSSASNGGLTGQLKMMVARSIFIKEKCILCTATRECEYLLRFSPPEKPEPHISEWHFACRFCRDRVTSVIDFFNYVNYLRQGIVGAGKKGATILSIFRYVLWLKRRMSQARTGSCSLFETELSAITAPGGGGDWEKFVNIIS